MDLQTHPGSQQRERIRRRGSNVVEFAITLPAFLLIILGIMDYGYLFSIQAGIDNAVSLGCRDGAKIDPLQGTPSSIAQSSVQAKAAYFCSGGSACTITVTDRSTGIYAVPNRTLECRIVRNALQPLTGFVPYPTSLRSVSFYRLEWQRTTGN